MAASIRGLGAAAASLRDPSPAVAEAMAICRRVADAPDPDALDRDDERLRDLVDAAIRDATRPLDEVVVLQRALDFVCAATFAQDGIRAVADGHRPLRDAELLDDALPPDRLLYRLFHTEGVAADRPRALAYGCRCSRARW